MTTLRLKDRPKTLITKINVRSTLLAAIRTDKRTSYKQGSDGKWYTQLKDVGVNVPVSEPCSDIKEAIEVLDTAKIVIESLPDDIFDIMCQVAIQDDGSILFNMQQAIRQIVRDPRCNSMSVNALLRYSELMNR